MDLAQAFRIALGVTVFATVFATGLTTTTEDLGYLRHRPSLLLRSLLATVVIAPLVALLVVRGLAVGTPAAIAIVAAALAPGLPTLPKAGKKMGGNVAFASSLLVVTAVCAVVTVPLWLMIISALGGVDVSVSPRSIALMLGLGLLLPLLLGAAIRRLAPKLAARVASPVDRVAEALLPGLALVVVLVGAEAIADLGWRALLAMLVAPLVALVVGHALGGPAPRDRSVLAIANAGRFPALAALIASAAFPDVRALPAVVAYLVISSLVALPYRLARRQPRARGRRVSAPPPALPAAPA